MGGLERAQGAWLTEGEMWEVLPSKSGVASEGGVWLCHQAGRDSPTKRSPNRFPSVGRDTGVKPRHRIQQKECGPPSRTNGRSLKHHL